MGAHPVRIAISENPVGVTPIKWRYYDSVVGIPGSGFVWVKKIGGKMLSCNTTGGWEERDPSITPGNYETFFLLPQTGVITVTPDPGNYISYVFYYTPIP